MPNRAKTQSVECTYYYLNYVAHTVGHPVLNTYRVFACKNNIARNRDFQPLNNILFMWIYVYTTTNTIKQLSL